MVDLQRPESTAPVVPFPGGVWGAGWDRQALIDHGVRLAELGFGIVRVYHPTDATTCSCGDPACLSIGKHPAGDRWQERAEHDPKNVRTLLGNPGNRSYGIVPPSGVFSWDVDGDAPARFRELADKYGAPPATRIHRSGAGAHVFYRWPDGVPGGSGHLFGVVTRWAPGGMTVGPGSIHAGTGRLYAVERDSEIATLPEAWARAAASWSTATNAAQDGAEPGDPDWKIPENGRHPWLVRQAARLRGTGLRAAALEAALLALNAERCDPPKPEAEVRRLAADYTRKSDDGGGGVFLLGSVAATDTAPAAIDAAELLELDLPPLRSIVPDLIPEGTTIVASPPKIGKSCLIYQVAVEVALGGELLGRQVATGSVLYLALEDGRRRGQVRLRAALEGRALPRGRLQVQWSARRIGAGLEDDIARWLDAHPDAAMVAVDTLQRVRPPSSGRRGAYEVDVEDLGRLQTLFRDRPTALVVVHHARKEAGDDFLASVSGTYGITGSADTIVVLKRKRLEAFGSIFVTGREIADAEIPVRFDGLTWQPAPQALTEASFERAEVYGVIDKAGPIFPAAIAAQLGSTRQSVQNMVAKLVDRGAVARTAGGYVTTATGLARAYTHIPDVSDVSERHRRHGTDSNGAEIEDYPESAWQVAG